MADVFICIQDALNWNGCRIETEVAKAYGIKRYKVPSEIVIENYKELVDKHGKYSLI